MKKTLAILSGMLMITILAACGPKGSTSGTGKYTEIAKCLTEKGVKFYGAFWCPHCADQKKILGDDMKYINYVECDPKGENAKAEECQKAGVERYPTWFFPGQGLEVGVHTPEDLAKKANCAVGSATQMSTQEAPKATPPAATTTQAVTQQ
jgi:glutaredoxin